MSDTDMNTDTAIDVNATAIAANLEVLHLTLVDATQRSAHTPPKRPVLK